MVASDVVMELLPKFLDSIDPRLLRRLEKDMELRIVFQPGVRQVGFMDNGVIGNKDNFSGTAVSAFEVL